jgi:acyl-CoA reductase-like NAD-dependent aldehyde dehydrogenase
VTRIAAFKFFNYGTRGVSPQPVFVHDSIKVKFIEEFKAEVRRQFSIHISPEIRALVQARIVGSAHPSLRPATR